MEKLTRKVLTEKSPYKLVNFTNSLDDISIMKVKSIDSIEECNDAFLKKSLFYQTNANLKNFTLNYYLIIEGSHGILAYKEDCEIIKNHV
jgi:hypothetical protein